ncbi:unnamed protein product [Pedinophyceae sp. YPF-701]|nr:unnamed protein product [Pedinophyceae sp. YPF-701]
METFLNVPPDELEELLTVALGRVEDFLRRECAPPNGVGSTTLVLTRIDAESSTRTRDIQATSTFLHEVSGNLPAFCRAVSTPDRQLGAADFRESDIGVTAQVDGATLGPVSCADVIYLSRMVFRDALRAAVVARDEHLRDAERGRAAHAFRGAIKIGPAHDPADVAVAGAWSPKFPSVIDVSLHTPPDQARRILSKATCAELGAQAVVRALRGTGALQALSKDTLVPPDACDAAALLEDAAQDWDAAGRFPCITINVLQSNMFNKPWVFLTLPDNVCWEVAAHDGETGHPPLVRLVAEVDRPGLFSLAMPVPPTWQDCMDTYKRLDGTLGGHGRGEGWRTELLQCVLDAHASRMRLQHDSPGRTLDIDDEVEMQMNVPEGELEELLRVALRQGYEFLEATQRQSGPEVCGKVVTRIESECWSETRDIRAVSTLNGDLTPENVDAFCRMISADGRKLRGKPRSGHPRVRATLEENGAAYGPLDCTDLVELGRGVSVLSSDHGDLGYQEVVQDFKDGSPLHCFRDKITTDAGGREIALELTGNLSRSWPHVLMVMAAPPTDFELSRREEEQLWLASLTRDTGGPEVWAQTVVRALRASGALRTISSRALLPPRGQAAKSASQQAWDRKGQFPAVSVNVSLGTFSSKHGSPLDAGVGLCMWLELPLGMRWKADPVSLPGSGVRRVAASVVREQELQVWHHFHTVQTPLWRDVARGVERGVAELQGAGDTRPLETLQLVAFHQYFNSLLGDWIHNLPDSTHMRLINGCFNANYMHELMDALADKGLTYVHRARPANARAQKGKKGRRRKGK